MPARAKSSADFEARISAAYAERDHALTQLAAAREELNALRMAARNQGEIAPPIHPVTAGLGPTPLRYVLVDKANDNLKGVVAPIHSLLKRLLSRGNG